jgi:hypothetical protein
VANFFADRYGYIGPFVFCLFPLTLVAIFATLWWPENYGDANARYPHRPITSNRPTPHAHEP